MQPEDFDDDLGVTTKLLNVEGARQRIVGMKSGTEWVKKTELDYERVLDRRNQAGVTDKYG